jgi:hypothetical protein
MSDGQRFDLVDYYYKDQQVKTSYDIEHIFSQSKQSELENKEILHNVGNLIVIPTQINGSLNDAS